MPAGSTPLEAIKHLYFGTSKATIRQDLDRAIDLLKSMDSDAERERAAVFMDGLSQMRSEWGVSGPGDNTGSGARPAPRRASAAPRRR
jgi:hypothetical protein